MTLALTHPPARIRRPLVAPLLLLGGLAALVVIGPLVIPHDPAAQDLVRTLEGPSAQHWFGTDHLGRDIAARLVHGGVRSLGIAVACVGFATGVGVALGLLAAYAGRVADIAIMRLADLMLAFPGILLALLISGFLGGGVLPMLIGIKLALWPQFARMARAIAIGELAQPHVEAARLAGFSALTILRRHVLPPVLRQTVTLATLGLGAAIMSISSLGFLGLGLQPPTPEWGAMISELLPYLAEAPVQMAAPCLAIFLAVLGATLLGQALAEPPTMPEEM
ncbi:MAG TPA: ABC transporter permease [Bosea sp. (in: a-proteobacteria)]|jgi:peptide/nickel transport system permease protein|uniref:ABC transporter permease n=1 Tax=Bosea sp. (in: a-proteobacteria) TaxID=1871050 RepID=UPI002DDCC5C3|nr:ABC transporter permease [Bosea sp. (in: a-proteobacteria)]HEV2554595.1 ABC transporter permease [Bosea sp. (in: a-proteobacteria)]